MKIQTTARIEDFRINDKSKNLPSDQTIDLELSAIDTGGGFKDPILDFSFTLPEGVTDSGTGDEQAEIALTLSDPDQKEHQVSFFYESWLQRVEDNRVEINGRLKEDQLSKETINFVFKLLR